jgi:hypothetical protein
LHRRELRRVQKDGAGQGIEIPPNWEDAEIRQWVMDCAKDAWVSKMDKTRMNRYQMAKQLYGLCDGGRLGATPEAATNSSLAEELGRNRGTVNAGGRVGPRHQMLKG